MPSEGLPAVSGKTHAAPTSTAVTDATAQALAFPALARFRFLLQAKDHIRFPPYTGSAWRGLLGHGLRRTACVIQQPTCVGCLLAQQCVYSTLFETPAPSAHAQAGYTAMPHPFVLDIDPSAPRDLAPGESFVLTVHLLGAAIAQVPFLIHALGLAGQGGFGRTGGCFSLTAVERELTLGHGDWELVYAHQARVYQTRETSPLYPPPAPLAVRLRLVTPLRIKRDGHFLGAHDLRFHDLMRALSRRLHTLAALQGGDPHVWDARALPADPEALDWQPRWLRWHEWTRYSSRQNTLMQFGGLIGEIDLAGPALGACWPALWLGQWIHVGKGTAFGLGGYRVDARADPVGAPSQACQS
jgi:hypothetical protein